MGLAVFLIRADMKNPAGPSSAVPKEEGSPVPDNSSKAAASTNPGSKSRPGASVPYLRYIILFTGLMLYLGLVVIISLWYKGLNTGTFLIAAQFLFVIILCALIALTWIRLAGLSKNKLNE
jgi:hypothetical protein